MRSAGEAADEVMRTRLREDGSESPGGVADEGMTATRRRVNTIPTGRVHQIRALSAFNGVSGRGAIFA